MFSSDEDTQGLDLQNFNVIKYTTRNVGIQCNIVNSRILFSLRGETISKGKTKGNDVMPYTSSGPQDISNSNEESCPNEAPTREWLSSRKCRQNMNCSMSSSIYELKTSKRKRYYPKKKLSIRTFSFKKVRGSIKYKEKWTKVNDENGEHSNTSYFSIKQNHPAGMSTPNGMVLSEQSNVLNPTSNLSSMKIGENCSTAGVDENGGNSNTSYFSIMQNHPAVTSIPYGNVLSEQTNPTSNSSTMKNGENCCTVVPEKRNKREQNTRRLSSRSRKIPRKKYPMDMGEFISILKKTRKYVFNSILNTGVDENGEHSNISYLSIKQNHSAGSTPNGNVLSEQSNIINSTSNLSSMKIGGNCSTTGVDNNGENSNTSYFSIMQNHPAVTSTPNGNDLSEQTNQTSNSSSTKNEENCCTVVPEKKNEREQNTRRLSSRSRKIPRKKYPMDMGEFVSIPKKPRKSVFNSILNTEQPQSTKTNKIKSRSFHGQELAKELFTSTSLKSKSRRRLYSPTKWLNSEEIETCLITDPIK